MNRLVTALIPFLLTTFAHATEIESIVYTGKGRAENFDCYEGAGADCAHAEKLAQDSALKRCYLDGNEQCTVKHVGPDHFGGRCPNTYCEATALVSAQAWAPSPCPTPTPQPIVRWHCRLTTPANPAPGYLGNGIDEAEALADAMRTCLLHETPYQCRKNSQPACSEE